MAIKAVFSGGAGIQATLQRKQVILSPELQTVWDASTNPEKDTFVDANDGEILPLVDAENIVVTDLADGTNNVPVNTAYASGIDVDDYLGGLGIVTLSSQAATAIVNIESNGGTLTNKEKYFVSIIVDALVSSGEWTKMKCFLTISDIFANASCNLTCWISGDLMTSGGGTVTVVSPTAPTGGNDSFAIYNRDITGAKTFLSGGAKIDFSAAGLWTYDANQSADRTKTYYASTAALVVTEETSSGNIELFINGVSQDSGAATAGSVSNSFSVADACQLFYISDATTDHLEIYTQFEDFRTSLHPEILYNFPPITQITSYRTGDSAWIWNNFLGHYREATTFWNGTHAELDRTDANPFFKLKNNNKWGHKFRFTGPTGGYLDLSDSNYYTAAGVLSDINTEFPTFNDGDGEAHKYFQDHLTGIAWPSGDLYRFGSGDSGAYSQNDSIDKALGTLFGGTMSDNSFIDWFCPPLSAYADISDNEGTTGADWWEWFPMSNNRNTSQFWTSDTYLATTTSGMQVRQSRQMSLQEDKTTTDRIIPCRLFI